MLPVFGRDYTILWRMAMEDGERLHTLFSSKRAAVQTLQQQILVQECLLSSLKLQLDQAKLELTETGVFSSPVCSKRWAPQSEAPHAVLPSMVDPEECINGVCVSTSVTVSVFQTKTGPQIVLDPTTYFFKFAELSLNTDDTDYALDEDTIAGVLGRVDTEGFAAIQRFVDKNKQLVLWDERVWRATQENRAAMVEFNVIVPVQLPHTQK